MWIGWDLSGSLAQTLKSQLTTGCFKLYFLLLGEVLRLYGFSCKLSAVFVYVTEHLFDIKLWYRRFCQTLWKQLSGWIHLSFWPALSFVAYSKFHRRLSLLLNLLVIGFLVYLRVNFKNIVVCCTMCTVYFWNIIQTRVTDWDLRNNNMFDCYVIMNCFPAK